MVWFCFFLFISLWLDNSWYYVIYSGLCWLLLLADCWLLFAVSEIDCGLLLIFLRLFVMLWLVLIVLFLLWLCVGLVWFVYFVCWCCCIITYLFRWLFRWFCVVWMLFTWLLRFGLVICGVFVWLCFVEGLLIVFVWFMWVCIYLVIVCCLSCGCFII